MPKRTKYAGRHRGRHRAEVRPRSSALPGAAAAALTLTATGAAVIPGLAGTAANASGDDTGALKNTNGSGSASGGVTGSAQVAGLREREAQSVMLTQAREARAEAAARASRAEKRQKLEDKQRKARAMAHRWVMPLSNFRFTSDFGARWGKLHAGDDLAAPIGSRIGALSSGTVVFAGQQSGYGNKVEIRHWDGTVSWYGHMSQIEVKVGEKVTPGQKVGEVGNTGHSTGPHLHLEIHPDGAGPVDPQPWLAKRGLKI
ncbi:M23 family metallopeptidase [Angustibacter luteus]|uniref:M23 family metallopeptidase n=1 Tax=Angustibacter luteus TaxID=658456 RepID=A0ABW1JGN6_9ACTN